jgi:hypothetical protein
MKCPYFAVSVPGWLLLSALSASLAVACGGDSRAGTASSTPNPTPTTGTGEAGSPSDNAQSSQAGSEACALGSEGCACTKGGACDDGLSCLSKVCVLESNDVGSGGSAGSPAADHEEVGGASTAAGGKSASAGGAPGSAGHVGIAGAPSVECAAPGGWCLQTSQCCQTGKNVGSNGATCLSDDFVCHANCTANSQCTSNCCAALQGVSYGVCADKSFCAATTPTTPKSCTDTAQCPGNCVGNCCPACTSEGGTNHCGQLCCDSSGFCFST